MVTLEDMGPNWTSVRDGARASTLSKNSEVVTDIASRFDQMIRYSALRLSSEVGETVEPVLSRKHRESPDKRLAYLVDSLVRDGVLEAKLRVPKTAGEIEVIADLRSQQVTAAMKIAAPEDRGSRGRVSWLINQLDSNDRGSLTLETYAKNAKAPITCTVAEADDDRLAAIGESKVEPYRFRVLRRVDMRTARRPTSRQQGFIGGVLELIDEFYEDVVQRITPWQPRVPKRKQVSTEPSSEERFVGDDIASEGNNGKDDLDE